jgi:D-arabinose 1-dehydrogenase-like Zn-dependent alcohol dehydrogenase
MLAVVLEQFGPASHLAVQTVPDPRPGPGEVLLRVRACGVCYHDVINRRGSLPRTSVPAILGHEVAGEVIDVGPGVTTWEVGDRAATLQRMSCGACPSCDAGRPSLCKRDNRFFGEELAGGSAGSPPSCRGRWLPPCAAPRAPRCTWCGRADACSPARRCS